MLRLLLKELRYRWMIHLLMVVLMSFIVSILVIQSSLNNSAEEKIKDLTHELGQSMLVVPDGTDLASFYEMRYGDEVMPDDYGDRIKSSAVGRHARMIEPRFYGNAKINDTDVVIIGRKARYGVVGNNSYESMEIGLGAARSLKLVVGDTLDVRGGTFRVEKVLDPPPKGFDMALFIPLQAAQRIFDRPGKINALHLGGCWCTLDIPGFAASVEEVLPGTMAITVDGMAEAQIQINEIMERYSVVLWAVGTIIVVGSIIFLILYMIRRGEREIGLLLSIGLLPRAIIMKNAVFAVSSAVTGAVFGYVLSVPLMSWFGKAFMRIGLTPSWQYLPHFVGAALFIALIASSIPSWLVTRLDPTHLLREE